MKAVVVREFGDPGTHRVEEVPSPVIGADEVLVDVAAAGVNFPDLLVMTGKYQILPPRPFSPGKDAAGVVRAVGAGVRNFAPGDRVAAQVEYGAYAAQVAVPARQVHRIPPEMSFVDAAAMGLVYQTAYFALVDRGGFRHGDTVLVNGAAGGIGLAAVQIAKGLGGEVVAGINAAGQEAVVRQSGADAVVDLAAPDLRESLRRSVHAATNGRGADVLIDPVGGDVFDASLRAMAWCGRAVVVGFAAGRIPEIKANYLLLKNISVSGLQWSDYRERMPERVAEVQQELTRLYLSGALRPHVMETYPLAQFADAIAVVGAGRAVGKLVLTLP